MRLRLRLRRGGTDARHDVDVAFCINRLTAQLGGAERQILRLSQHLVEDGFRVALVARGCRDPSIDLHHEVLRIDPDWIHSGTSLTRARQIRIAIRARTGRIAKAGLRPILDRRIVRLVAVERQRWGAGSPYHESEIRRLGVLRAGKKYRGFSEAFELLNATTVFSMLGTANLWAAFQRFDRSFRLVISYRNDPRFDKKGEPLDSLALIAHLRADLVTANSQGSLAVLKELPEFSGKAVALAPNVGPKPSDASGAPARRFVVLGRLAPHKRAATSLALFAGLLEELPDWTLTFAGRGSEEPRLRRHVDELGLSDRVEFLGHVADVAGLLSKGGVLLHLSAYEGTPNAVMEAMAAGIPSIVTDASPGPVELVDGVTEDHDDPCGIVCAEGDLPGIARAMVLLASDDELRDRLGRAAVRRAERATWPAVRAQWLEILGMCGASDGAANQVSSES